MQVKKMSLNKCSDESIYFSVVIPLYNKEKHIKRTIESVLSQTFGNFEIIIVDDGSSDNGVIEVKKCNDPRINLVRQQNRGVSAARNKGIKLAKYDYIAFLDADDSWDEMFLETIKQLIINYPCAGAYGTGYKFSSTNKGEKIANSISRLGLNWEGLLDDYFKYAIIDPIITSSSVVIPKEVFKKIGYFLEFINRGEDLEMWCRIALKYSIAFNSNICSSYFIDSNNRACKSKPVIEKTFSYYSEDILHKNMNERNATVYFERYMHQKIINKALLHTKLNNRIEAKKILKSYKLNKHNWKPYLKTIIKLLMYNSSKQ